MIMQHKHLAFKDGWFIALEGGKQALLIQLF